MSDDIIPVKTLKERAVELFATNPDIEVQRVAELLNVHRNRVFEMRKDPNFHQQVQDRFMVELENEVPSMVSALKREVLAGNVQATRLMFEYMNKLQKNINITIDSPFEKWLKKAEVDPDIQDAEIIGDMPEFSDLPPRTADNSPLRAKEELNKLQKSTAEANYQKKTERTTEEAT